MALINSRSFLPLFITQFLEAFNDNLLKNALVMLITFKIAYETGENTQVLITIAAGLFILPFFLFSASAGQFADKYERTFIIKIIKISEIIIAALATLALIYHKSWFLISLLFCAGVHSTFFGPIKYALLPQLIPANKLITANAYFSAGTFIAILFGTICGGVLILHDYGTFIVSALLCVIAVTGFISCLFIPYAPGPDPQLKISHNILQETKHIINYSRSNKHVFFAIIAISWFWFIGAIFLSQMPSYVRDIIRSEPKVVSIFLTTFTIGIGIGSFLCNKLLKGKIKATYSPYALIIMSLFIIDMYFASQDQNYHNLHGFLSWERFIHMNSSIRLLVDMLLIAICGGIYIVPLYAIMQHESDNLYRARIIAANNVLNSLFMVLAAIFTLGMLIPQRTIPEIYLAIGFINIPVALMLHKYLIKS